jgi:hypothetical protein
VIVCISFELKKKKGHKVELKKESVHLQATHEISISLLIT